MANIFPFNVINMMTLPGQDGKVQYEIVGYNICRKAFLGLLCINAKRAPSIQFGICFDLTLGTTKKQLKMKNNSLDLSCLLALEIGSKVDRLLKSGEAFDANQVPVDKRKFNGRQTTEKTNSVDTFFEMVI